MREEICLKAPAKINWNLEVTGIRGDGYHELRSIMQNISLYDTIRLRLSQSDECISEPPCDCSAEDNLAMRAWRLLKNRYHLPYHMHIAIQKQIPAGRGLAGGSADAAAVLLAVNAMCDLGLSIDELSQLGFSLGADVPFCLHGGLAVVEGAGETIRALTPLAQYRLILVDPGIFISTPKVFARYDHLPMGNPSDPKKLLTALLSGDIEGIKTSHGNMLEIPAADICPKIGQVRSILESMGGIVFFSGSGSCFFVLDYAKDQEASYLDLLAQQGMQAMAVETIANGITSID